MMEDIMESPLQHNYIGTDVYGSTHHSTAVIANILGILLLAFSGLLALDHYLRPIATILAMCASALTIIVHCRNLLKDK